MILVLSYLSYIGWLSTLYNVDPFRLLCFKVILSLSSSLLSLSSNCPLTVLSAFKNIIMKYGNCNKHPQITYHYCSGNCEPLKVGPSVFTSSAAFVLHVSVLFIIIIIIIAITIILQGVPKNAL